uniref:Uncharacterized protein n=1 Tax=Sus scrofa TaxID=9823 RepID=A0A8D1BN13_PIG
MKGTPLLVLALLVTRGLGIACPMFYELLSVVSFGIRPLLDSSMDLINATEPEREAIKKAQDCFIDTGVFNIPPEPSHLLLSLAWLVGAILIVACLMAAPSPAVGLWARGSFWGWRAVTEDEE